MAIYQGEERYFIPELRYNREHANRIVRVVEVGIIVSRAETEEGRRFAAFNSELKRLKEAE